MVYLSAKKLAPSTISYYISALKLDLSLIPPKNLFSKRSDCSKQIRIYGSLSLTLYYKNWCWLLFTPSIKPAYHILLFQTTFLVAFYGFFRVGELTIKTPERRHSVIQFQSLSFLKSRSEVQAAKLVIWDYEHNTTGRGVLSVMFKNEQRVF